MNSYHNAWKGQRGVSNAHKRFFSPHHSVLSLRHGVALPRPFVWQMYPSFIHPYIEGQPLSLISGMGTFMRFSVTALKAMEVETLVSKT